MHIGYRKLKFNKTMRKIDIDLAKYDPKLANMDDEDIEKTMVIAIGAIETFLKGGRKMGFFDMDSKLKLEQLV